MTDSVTDSGEFELITPSYRPDFELCADLVGSARRFAPPGTRHTLVVSPRDMRLFQRLEDERTVVRSTTEFLPRSFLSLRPKNVWLNLAAPWPPVRGWITQQIIKLAAVAESRARAVLVVDSDVRFIRPFSAVTFGAGADAEVPLYRLPGAVHSGMARHLLWDATARRMLGLPERGSAAPDDYICCPCLWDPEVVREALARVAGIAGTTWQTAVGRELHFSEMVLYGVFLEHTATPRTVQRMHCLNHYDEAALDADRLETFLGTAEDDHVAVMISAKSHTDVELRRRALSRFDEV